MRLLLISLSLSAFVNVAGAATSSPSGVPTTDAEFAGHVLQFAVAGRKTGEVLEDLRASGFTCFEHENRVLSDFMGSVTFQRHVCGGPVPALHGCARNVELATFGGVLKHIRISLEHPDGTPNAGRACAR